MDKDKVEIRAQEDAHFEHVSSKSGGKREILSEETLSFKLHASSLASIVV
jgi:hypothetical protein